MTTNPSFSERHGFQSQSSPITVRYEAPPFLRRGVLSIAGKSGFSPKFLRSTICDVLDEMPDEAHNWGDPNVMHECETLIQGCEWFEVYDVCEALCHVAMKRGDSAFEKKLNGFFIKKGIGWKMEDGLLFVRGEEDYEKTTTGVQSILEESDRPDAAKELKLAKEDLSKRPDPDVTGAIQHSMASLECLATDILGSQKTLGAIINNLDLPSPVDKAAEKMWGFASNQGRHIKEGKKPEFAEAMLTVHFCAALIAYLSQKEQD